MSNKPKTIPQSGSGLRFHFVLTHFVLKNIASSYFVNTNKTSMHYKFTAFPTRALQQLCTESERDLHSRIHLAASTKKKKKKITKLFPVCGCLQAAVGSQEDSLHTYFYHSGWSMSAQCHKRCTVLDRKICGQIDI